MVSIVVATVATMVSTTVVAQEAISPKLPRSLLVAVCLLPHAMALLSLFVAAVAVAPGAATIAVAAAAAGTANATGHKPPPQWHRTASTVCGSVQCA